MPAYRKSYSCESITIRLTEDWKHSLDMGQPVCILSTDMSKAFDSMHHNLLMAKLKPYGLTDNSMKLINSYFQDRENRTRDSGYKQLETYAERLSPGIVIRTTVMERLPK